MIAIIGTRHRLMTQIIELSDLREVDTIEDFIAYRGNVPHADELRSTECVIVLSGTGPERSVKATKWLIDEFAPDLVISVGYSGCTHEDSVPGEVLVASRSITLEGLPVQWSIGDAEKFELSRNIISTARRAVETGGLDYQIGSMATIEGIIRTAEMKKWLRATFDIQAIDREAHHVAKVCEANSSTELLIARCGIDAGDLTSRFLFERINDHPKARVVIPVALHLGAHPTHWPDFRQFSRNSNLGREALTSFISIFLQTWEAERRSGDNGSGN